MALPRIQSLIITKLNELGFLTEGDTEQIINSDREFTSAALERMLLVDFKLSAMQILMAKSQAFNISPFFAANFSTNQSNFEELEPVFCAEHKVIPVGSIGDAYIIAISNPFDLQVIRQVERTTGRRVNVLLALEQDVEGQIKDIQNQQNADGEAYSEVVSAVREKYDESVQELIHEDIKNEESTPIIQLANRVIEEAYASGASDIHIEPYEQECRVRIRIDGVCYNKITLPPKIAVILVTRLKVMANLDIAEKRVPQDGRITFKQFTRKNLDIDIRVSTAPLPFGEGLVMRLLDKQKSIIALKSLGFEDENLKKYEDIIKRPYGMVLHCGPTGSGKTTTLYSALNIINQPGLVIRTAEDPIEYVQEGICQVQMNRKIGLTFASMLRSFLRQDPDVILVGEIRDLETAKIAVEASLTGHLLFSTLHTNDAPSAVPRLIEMGVEPYLVAASLICVCAQRLIRRICPSCRQQCEPDEREKAILERGIGWSGPVYKINSSGCSNCMRSGYKGRVGIHELMIGTENMLSHINANSETDKIKKVAIDEGMKTLHQDGLFKVRDGFTSMAEAISIAPPDIQVEEKVVTA